MDEHLAALSREIGMICSMRKLLISTAESCTGGWAAEVITHTPGSSSWFERGFVTYANAAKTDMLGVLMHTIETFGAVSVETAAEMASGALLHSNATISLAITGVAGPGGGSAEKPVGTVCFGWCAKDQAGAIQVPSCERRLFSGDRELIRRQAVVCGLSGLIERARNMP